MEGTARTDADLVALARDGDGEAFDELFRRWFTPVWNVSRGVLRDPGLAAEVAQDCFLVAWQSLGTLEDSRAFGGWMLRIARNRSLNRLGRERRSLALDDEVLHRLRDGGAPCPVDPSAVGGPAELLEIRDRQELVWAAAVALGERDWSLLDLHLRHGLTPAELAEELGVTANNAHQLLFRLRGKVGDAVGAYLLWRTTTVGCDELRRVVAGHPAFDRAAWRAVSRHRGGCGTCSERQALLVRPEQLLAGVPLAVPLPAVVDQVVGGLRAGGVPVTAPGPATVGAPTPTGRPGRSQAGIAPAPIAASRPDDGRTTHHVGGSRRRLAALVVAAAVGAAGVWMVRTTRTSPTEHLASGSEAAGPTGPEPSDALPAVDGDETGDGPHGEQEIVDDEAPPPAVTDPVGEDPVEVDGGVGEPSGDDGDSGDGVTDGPAGEDPGGQDPPGEGRADGPGGLTAQPPPGDGVDPENPSEPAFSVSVDLSSDGAACDRNGGVRWRFVWAVVGATTPVTSELVVATADPERFPAGGDGSAAFCAPGGTSWTIDAADSDGATTRSGILPGDRSGVPPAEPRLTGNRSREEP